MTKQLTNETREAIRRKILDKLFHVRKPVPERFAEIAAKRESTRLRQMG